MPYQLSIFFVKILQILNVLCEITNIKEARAPLSAPLLFNHLKLELSVPAAMKFKAQ